MYESLLQHTKEHEMTVKDFNRQKSNGGTVMVTSVDEIRTFKQKKGKGYTAKSSSGKSSSKCSTLHPLREYPAYGKKCHKCGLKTISAVVVGLSTRAREMATVEDHPELRAQRDITDPRAEADAPDPDQDPTVDPIYGVPTALSSIEKTRYNRKVWLRKCLTKFPDVDPLAAPMRQTQVVEQRSSHY